MEKDIPSLEEALEMALPQDKLYFLTPEQERETDARSASYAEGIRQSQITGYQHLREIGFL